MTPTSIDKDINRVIEEIKDLKSYDPGRFALMVNQAPEMIENYNKGAKKTKYNTLNPSINVHLEGIGTRWKVFQQLTSSGPRAQKEIMAGTILKNSNRHYQETLNKNYDEFLGPLYKDL